MREIIKFDTYEEGAIKLINDLKFIINRDRKFKNKPPVLMLSGGVDSMLLGCIAKKYFGLKDSITVGVVKDTHDVKVSQDTAEKLGINNKLVLTTLEEVMDNLHLIKGHQSITTLFNVVYYLTFKLCLEKIDVKGVDLIQGDGADTLLGSLQTFMYRLTPQAMKEHNVDKDTAKTILKQNYYAEAIQSKGAKKGSGHLFLEVANELGANPIMAFKNPDILRWVNDLHYSYAEPHKKTFPKEVIKYMGYEPNKVKRTVMEYGTGIFEVVEEKLMLMTGANSRNAAVKKLVNSGATLPGF